MHHAQHAEGWVVTLLEARFGHDPVCAAFPDTKSPFPDTKSPFLDTKSLLAIIQGPVVFT